MSDSVTTPMNDDDVDGIYQYMAWHFTKAGFSGQMFHYLELWHKEMAEAKVVKEIAQKALANYKASH